MARKMECYVQRAKSSQLQERWRRVGQVGAVLHQRHSMQLRKPERSSHRSHLGVLQRRRIRLYTLHTHPHPTCTVPNLHLAQSRLHLVNFPRYSHPLLHPAHPPLRPPLLLHLVESFLDLTLLLLLLRKVSLSGHARAPALTLTLTSHRRAPLLVL